MITYISKIFREAYPKARFKWKEPRRWVIARDVNKTQNADWLRKLPWVGFGVVMALVVWLPTVLDPDKKSVSFTTMLALGLFLGVFLVYGVPLMNKFCPSEIKVYDHGLLMSRGNDNGFAKWGSLTEFTIQKISDVTVLGLHYENSRLDLLGLADNLAVADLRAFLTDRGLNETQTEQDMMRR